ncbi:tetratricopeptide repeat protein [Cupriavidus sp. PET2-C1]
MPSKASKSPAPPERERLLPPAFVLTFAAMVGIGLALMFPRETLRERLLGEGRAVDGLSVAYLEAWLRATPEDSDFMAVLAEQYARTGRLEEAEHMVGRLEARYAASTQGPVRNRSAADAELPNQILRTRIEITQQRAFAALPDTPERKHYIELLSRMLDQALPMEWERADLEELATTARAINALKPAQQFYLALAKRDPARAELWNAQAASVALAGGDYRQAADALFAAQARAADPAEQRRLFMAALKTLQSGNELDRALDQAEQHGGKLLDNAEVLRYLTRLALAANRPELAARYVQRLLRLPPSMQPMPDGASLRRAEVRRVAAAQPWAAQGVVFLDGPRGLALHRAMGEAAMPHLRRVADSAGAGAAPAAERPFNADDYELAFQVFLAAGKLDDAQRVAEAAVRRQPGEARWRERLAQVAEWNRQPAVALKSWLEYAQATNDETAWKAVLRLAPGLNDDRAYLAALRHRAGSGDLATVDQVVAAYERLGEPEQGLAFLQSLSHGPNARQIMERQAELAERAGKDDRALALYTELQQRFGPRPQYALKQASLLYVRGKLADALQAMVPSMRTARSTDIEYWRTLTELARLNQRGDLLEQGYRQLILAMAGKHDDHCMAMPAGSGRNACLGEVRDTEEADFSNLIDFYDSSPIDAGRIAEASWRKGGKPVALELAINYYTRARAYGRVANLLQGLSADQLKQAEHSSRFLALRAEYQRVRGERVLALADLRRAASLPDADSETLAALMWALVDLGSDTEVRALMLRLKREAEDNPDLWGAFAAGSMRFEDGRAALHYLRKMADGKSADPLWLGLAADACDAIGQASTAWRLRRQAWVDLHSDRFAAARRTSDPRSMDPAAGEDDAQGGPAPADLRRQTVALGQIFASGDVSRRLVIEMLRGDRAVMAGSNGANRRGPADPPSRLGEIPGLPPLDAEVPAGMAQREARQQAVVSSAAKEVALAWALSTESNELARAWLARQYARQLLRPAYAEITLALANQDLAELDRMLERHAGRIPADSQIEANVQLDRLGAAQTLAYETQDLTRTSDALQETLQDTLLFNAQAIEPRVTYQRQNPLSFFDYSLGGGVRLWDGYDLNLLGAWRTQRSLDPAQLTGVPSSDRRGELSLGYRDQHLRWRLGVGRRDGLDSVTTARFTGEWRESSRLSVTTLAGLNQSADESAPLRVGGVKDVLGLGATYNFGRREFVGGRIEYDRFRGQDGSQLGHGLVYDLELGYRIRTAYPDYTVRLVGTHASYNVRGGTLGSKLATLVPTDAQATPGFYMPQGFTQAGVTFGFGTELIDDYTRKWRPFAEIGLLHDTRAGQNFRAQLGLAGKVLGNDHLSMYVQHETAARNGGTPLTQVGARYKWLF